MTSKDTSSGKINEVLTHSKFFDADKPDITIDYYMPPFVSLLVPVAALVEISFLRLLADPQRKIIEIRNDVVRILKISSTNG